MPDLLQFAAAREAESESWDRAAPEAALIETVNGRPNVFRVTLPDSSDVYRCRYERDHGAYVGYCECRGYQYHRYPCAHLCTLRQAEFVGAPRATDARGQPVCAVDADEERAQQHVEKIVADRGTRGERR